MDKGKRNNEKEIEVMWEELKQILFNNVMKKKIKKKKRCHRLQGWKIWWKPNGFGFHQILVEH